MAEVSTPNHNTLFGLEKKSILLKYYKKCISWRLPFYELARFGPYPRTVLKCCWWTKNTDRKHATKEGIQWGFFCFFFVNYFFLFVVLYQPVTFSQFSISYAMDWEPSHGRIRVMLGRSGKVVCTLKVDPVSSTGRGDVQVVRVEGSSHQTEIERLQVKFCLLSLVNCERATLQPSTLPRVITITLARCYLAENEILTHLKPFWIASVFFWKDKPFIITNCAPSDGQT